MRQPDRATRALPRNSGMTLLEVVVALSIGAMAVATAVTAFQALLRAHEDKSRFAGEMVRSAALRVSLATWIQGAMPTDGDVDHFRGLAHEGQHGAADELTLLTTAGTPVGEGEIEMHLRVAPRDAAHAAGLTVEFRNPASGQSELLELDTTVTTLRMSYLASRDSATRWMPGWITASALPRAVRIVLGTNRFDDNGVLLHLPIIVSLDLAP